MDLGFDVDEQLEKLAKVPKPVRLAAVAGLLAALGAGYYFMWYQDYQAAAQRHRVKAQELQRKLNEVRVVANNIGDFEAEVADLERQLDAALKQLPNRKQFEDLLRDISTAGKKVGVEIKSISRKPEVNRDFYAEVPFSISLEGGYHDVARFFERVSQLPRIVNVGSLRIRGEDKRGSEVVIKVEGTATTFRFLGEADADTAATERVWRESEVIA